MDRLVHGPRHVTEALLEAGLVSILVVGLAAGTAFAAKGGSSSGTGGSKGGSMSCTVKAPLVKVDNTYGWSLYGSWGLPGQRLTYAIDVINYDAGCGSSTFAIAMAAPSGFSVSLPTSSVSLASGASAYVYASVTSPTVVADGDYGLSVTATRTGTSSNTASFTTYYKVYSSDTAAPTLYYPNPGDGTTITGKSYNFVVSSNDDHAVKTIDLYIDGVYRTTTTCDDISYTCSLYSKQSITKGQHTATFKAYDWLGNIATLTVRYTVS